MQEELEGHPQADAPAKPGSQPGSSAEGRGISRLSIAGIICFLVGLPLVSITDSVILSTIGFLLEIVAAVALIAFVMRLAGDGAGPGAEETERDGSRQGP